MIDLILQCIGLATVISFALALLKVGWEKVKVAWCEHTYEVSGVVQSGNTQLVFLVCKECGKEMLITLDTKKAKISLEPLDKV